MTAFDVELLTFIEQNPDLMIKEIVEKSNWEYTRIWRGIKRLLSTGEIVESAVGAFNANRYRVKWKALENIHDIPTADVLIPEIRIGKRPPLNLSAFLAAVAKTGDVPLFSVTRKIQFRFIQIICARLQRSLELQQIEYPVSSFNSGEMLNDLIGEVEDFLETLKDFRNHTFWWRDDYLRYLIHDKNFPSFEVIEVANNIAKMKEEQAGG